MRLVLSVLLLGTLGAGTTAAADLSCEAKSGDATVALLELYTSEGCSSCPPADRWFKELPAKGLEPRRLIPLAFHVDYWDELGWEDPFAQNDFTQRQAGFVRRGGARSVYTPAFFLNGGEYYPWRWRNLGAAVNEVNRTPPRAAIRLRLRQSGSQLTIEADATLKTATRAGFYVALTENNLSTRVRAGENEGRTLEHAAVVRRLVGPAFFDKSGNGRLRQTLNLDDGGWKRADLGVAAFVQELNGTDVLQALALPLCR
jgi:hypothetical protein